MAQLNPEEHNLSADSSGQADQSNLEDTKPRRIVPQTEQTAPETPEDAAAETRAVSLFGELENLEAETSTDDVPRGYEHTIPPPTTIPTASIDGAAVFDAAPSPADVSAEPRPRSKGVKASKTGRGGKKKSAKGRPRSRRANLRGMLIPLLGLLGILIVACLGVAGGYAKGITDRRSAESTQVIQLVEQQFQLGVQKMEAGDYYHARQHLEYVIQKNPGYPGAAEKYSEVLLYLNATATPTMQPTPTLTPTPDTRANDDLFSQAQQAILDSSWDQAVESLLALRKKDEAYRPVEIDGMLYLALRNRGREKIVQTDLESGIYDLTLASKFGPLDSEAQGLLNWSQLYITGASFWEIDWAQVVDYFSQIAPNMPNLMDASKMTATERLRIGLFNYGNTLAQQGQWCPAMERYAQSLEMAPDAEVQTAYEQAAGRCGGGDGGGAQPTKRNRRGTPSP